MLLPMGQAQEGERFVGHRHFWERALSRRQFIGTAAGASAAVLSSGLWLPTVAQAAGEHVATVAPRPIPGGIQPLGPGTPIFHVFLPGEGHEPITITDFHGSIGLADITGAGTGKLSGDKTMRLTFDTDVRFMQGTYIGVDGARHRGTFAFI